MTLQWSTGLLVNIYDNTVRIAGKVYSNVHINLGHLFVDFGLGRCEGFDRPD